MTDGREGDDLKPVWGCVLIGGRSRRMGRPKHLLSHNGLTWLELAVEKLRPRVEQVVISGEGEIPFSLAGLPVIPDIAGLAGPLAGVLAVMRRKPDVSWLVAACDLPYLQVEALDWLLSFRGPRVRAVLPDLDRSGRVEPVLAYYDRDCRENLEELVRRGSLKLSDLTGGPGVLTPQPPAEIRNSWRNINVPAELAGLE